MRRYATLRRNATLKTKVIPRSVSWENIVFLRPEWAPSCARRRPRRNNHIEGVEVGTTENMITNSLRSLSTLVALKIILLLHWRSLLHFLPWRSSSTHLSERAGKIQQRLMVFEKKKKGVVGPGSRAQTRLGAEKTECPLQRTTTHTVFQYSK